MYFITNKKNNNIRDKINELLESVEKGREKNKIKQQIIELYFYIVSKDA